jgi:hypothetical protein
MYQGLDTKVQTSRMVTKPVAPSNHRWIPNPLGVAALMLEEPIRCKE